MTDPQTRDLRTAGHLSVTALTKRFNAQVALDAVAFEVTPGKVTGLIGQNGAGKSTLIGVISGKYRPTEGEVRLGEAILADPEAYAPELRDQIAVVHQEGSIIPHLTVAENMMLADHARRPFARVTPRAAGDRVKEKYAELGLRPPDPMRECGLLSPADTKLLELVRALGSSARVLLLDEPTASLDPHMAQWLLATIRRVVRERLVGLVFVSHRLREVRAVSDEVTVLRNGQVAWSGPATGVSEADMVRHIAGHPIQRRQDTAAEAHAGDRQRGRVALELREVVAPGLRPITLTLHQGEILGVAGVDGQGQHQLLYSLAGLHQHSGAVMVHGKPARTRSRQRAMAAGVSFLADDRSRQGLIGTMTISDNLVVAVLTRLARWRLIRDPRREREFVGEATERFAIKMADPRGSMLSLSGGNQQKVLLARALSVARDVVVLFEPTQGVDVGAKGEIYELLRRLRADGAAVMLYSSDEEELCELCDRVIVMGNGSIVGELMADELSRDRIVEAMVAYSATQTSPPAPGSVAA